MRINLDCVQSGRIYLRHQVRGDSEWNDLDLILAFNFMECKKL